MFEAKSGIFEAKSGIFEASLKVVLKQLQNALKIHCKSIKNALLGKLVPKKVLDAKGKFSRSEREFRVPTTISFDNIGSDIYTIIEIDTRDRIGLIHDLANTLYKNNISIFTAIIATYGEQAVDTIYVKDLFGLKLHSTAKQDRILINLRNAIVEGAGKAME